MAASRLIHGLRRFPRHIVLDQKPFAAFWTRPIGQNRSFHNSANQKGRPTMRTSHRLFSVRELQFPPSHPRYLTPTLASGQHFRIIRALEYDFVTMQPNFERPAAPRKRGNPNWG